MKIAAILLAGLALASCVDRSSGPTKVVQPICVTQPQSQKCLDGTVAGAKTGVQP